MRSAHFVHSLVLSVCLVMYLGCKHVQHTNSIGITGSTIESVVVVQDSNFTGRGNDNEVLLRLSINSTAAAYLQAIELDLSGCSSLADIDYIKVYSTAFHSRFDSRNVVAARLLGRVPATEETFSIPLHGRLDTGNNYLWITAEISDTATEGNVVDAALRSVRTDRQYYRIDDGDPPGSREVLLRRKLLFAPGDAGSASYRIPAIITAGDGSLVVLTDKRKEGASDLPFDIDIVCRRSSDGGSSWSGPLTIVEGRGVGAGFGDAVLMKTASGKLVALFVGGPGLWQSRPDDPIRSYMCTSRDHGKSWSEPVDITSSIFGPGAAPPSDGWLASFFGSGRGLTLESGRIMAVAAIRKTDADHRLDNHVVYSDDEGETWQLSALAISGGDEAKVVQLNDGDVLMSSRGEVRQWARSSDGGLSWNARGQWPELSGNPTNGDMLRYTSTQDGYTKNRLLHTIPFSPVRERVSIFMSYDEGISWPVRKTLDAGLSAYSSITILDDGTIGVYLEEENGNGYYDMYFLNFSLGWLSNGEDSLER